MSEQISTAPAPITSEQQAPSYTPEQPQSLGESEDTAESPNPTPERTPDTPDEAAARETLGQNSDLENEAGERAGWRIRALNRKDRIQSTVTLQTARQLRLENRAARLERKLATAKPHSRKAMRLETALNLANYRAKKISNAREKTFGKMHDRSNGYDAEIKKIAMIEKKRHEVIVKLRVAIEKKRRRKLVEQYAREMKQSDPSLRQRAHHELSGGNRRREQLHKEIASWKGKGIQRFEKTLLAEVERKYTDRLRKAGIR